MLELGIYACTAQSLPLQVYSYIGIYTLAGLPLVLCWMSRPMKRLWLVTPDKQTTGKTTVKAMGFAFRVTSEPAGIRFVFTIYM